MWLVGFVTGKAIGLECDVEYWLYVAGCTFDIYVRAKQGMVGVYGVVKSNLWPAGRYMAGVALSAEMTFVIVIVFVARGTLGGQTIGERVVAVAGITGLFPMLAVEQEVSVARMVEACVLPACWLVTVAAFITAAAIVGVILGVASEARAWCVRKRIVGMAVEARRSQVFAD